MLGSEGVRRRDVETLALSSATGPLRGDDEPGFARHQLAPSGVLLPARLHERRYWDVGTVDERRGLCVCLSGRSAVPHGCRT